MSTKTFRFNEHDVCINPETIYIGKEILVELAEYDNVWVYGLHYGFTHIFRGYPCKKSKENFPTRDEALKYVIKKLIGLLNENIISHKNNKFYQPDVDSMKRAVKDLKQYLYDMTYIQLELF